MRKLFVVLLLSLFTNFAYTQNAQNPIFSTTTFTVTAAPISLPGVEQTLSGAQTDIMLNVTDNNAIGQTTFITTPGTFIGGRYDRHFPSVQNYLDKLPSLNGYQFQVYATASFGVVKANSENHWGERAGFGIRYGNNNVWGVGLEVMANNLPGISHWAPSIAFGPNFHF